MIYLVLKHEGGVTPSYSAEHINMKLGTAVVMMYVLKRSTPTVDVNVLVHRIIDLKWSQLHALF